MDGYPSPSLDPNVPLLAVCGLAPPNTIKPLLTDPDLKERAILVRSELPLVQSSVAQIILRFLQDADVAQLPWTEHRSRRHRFKISHVGREFLLPPRRACLPDQADAPTSGLVLHSPFSPLSPGSTLYPDGLIDVRWLQKHQHMLPSLCLCFYTLTSDPTLATLHDNQLKADVNAVKTALQQSGYRTRLAVVILSDQSPSSMAQYQERLENIRRTTGLDPKSSLFVLPTKRSESDLEIAVDSVLGAVYDQSLEYYRDLARHARKKKGRGAVPQPTIPPTTGTSHTLSLQDWNVRFDFKIAVLADFRQEYDAALRSYEQAYDTLLGSDVIELIPAWDSRFNNARLLADILAIRALKCLLMSGQSTAAVRRWQGHHARICNLIDRNGRGTNNYGFKAWQARWATVMANLIEKANFPELEPSSLLLFRPPEKNLSAERLQPWELLHHAGYWYQAAAGHLIDRRRLALSIPDDDRKPLDSSARQKAYKYDTFLCPEPYEEYPLEGVGVNHAQLILDYLLRARTEFQKRRQKRATVELTLGCCKQLELLGNWQSLVELLTPLWRDRSFRSEGWWDIVEAVGWMLRNAAAQVGQKGLIVAIDWELMSRTFDRRLKWHYDISRSLDGLGVEQPPAIHMDDEQITSFLTANFVFKHDEGKAGQTCLVQLTLVSHAFHDAAPVVLKSLHVHVQGGLREIYLEHDPNTDQAHNPQLLDIAHVSLNEIGRNVDSPSDDEPEDKVDASSSTVLAGKQNLTLTPGNTRVLEMNVPLKEPGDAKVNLIQVTVASEAFVLNYSIKFDRRATGGQWYTGPSSRRFFSRPEPWGIRILPRPPKMRIDTRKELAQYYTNEPIQLGLDIINEEDSEATARMDIIVRGDGTPKYTSQIFSSQKPSESVKEGNSGASSAMSTIKASETRRGIISLDAIDLPTELDILVKLSYHLVSDPSTPIMQEATFHINVVSPFEASYDLLPRLHPDWPSLFDAENVQDASHDDGHVRTWQGLSQKWALITRYASFAHEDVCISDLDVEVVATQGNVRCTVTKAHPLLAAHQTLRPKTMEEGHFDLVSQNLSVDDRSPSTADLAFIIKWRRASSDETVVNVSRLSIPRFYVTVAEPRVLASASYSMGKKPGLLFLDITIENPSSHFLTFGLTMEPSEEFAFSGAKSTTLNVLPLARRSIVYRLLPFSTGTWIRPTLVVRDKYFQKVLKIIPTEGMKSDKEGVLLWVPPEDDDDGVGE
ncbi:Gryzun, putative trafficking through golgi-domain-containing protein [Xylariaceae sp. FL0255]|nr:Gryzun, putative trafficking through golgi-domain-containing protein [Xylariaceae sp. FL0255]